MPWTSLSNPIRFGPVCQVEKAEMEKANLSGKGASAKKNGLHPLALVAQVNLIG
jgi:hypothetical protein